ncbi:MAG: DUF882 domain-containing protein [Rhizobiales bacterium]|nr:DUF882 domain-containing protein [Hyphomicrobiales bacterium]
MRSAAEAIHPMAFSIRSMMTLVAIGSLSLLIAAQDIVADPNGERILTVYNIHSKDTVSVIYKRNGRYVPESLEKLNWVMRDWRRNEPTKMDPELLDIIWEVHTELGSREPIHLISGYRSPSTNEMLRRTQGGQARNSQHTRGKAADVHFPDVPAKRLRYAALVRERGGVGYYPTSAVPFVHIDTGNVRHWPRLPRQELALLFPDGKTRHRPSSGGPVTRADYERARTANPELARFVTAYHELRGKPSDGAGIMVASASGRRIDGTGQGSPSIAAPAPVLASFAPVEAERRVAAVSTTAPAAGPLVAPVPASTTRIASVSPRIEAPAPSLASLGRETRTGASTPSPWSAEITAEPTSNGSATASAPVATGDAIAGLIETNPAPTTERPAAARGFAGNAWQTSFEVPAPRLVAALDAFSNDGSAVGETGTSLPGTLTLAEAYLELTGWAGAPEYDPEHPGELHYRPFPIGPLLTENPTIDDAALAALVHPDQNGARDMIDLDEDGMPLRFRPGIQFAEMMWSDMFTGGSSANVLAAGFENASSGRRVRTATRN